MVTNANGDVQLKGRFDCTAAGVVIHASAVTSCALAKPVEGFRIVFGERLHLVEGFKQNPLYQGGGFPMAERFNLIAKMLIFISTGEKN